jgi:hypothetical protein
MKRYLLIFSILLGTISLTAQTTISSSDITLSASSTPMSVAWNPSYSSYYASSGGSTLSPLCTFNSSGTLITSTSVNFDNRGLWYNTSNGRIEGSDYSIGNIGYYPLDGSGTPNGNVVITGGGSIPNAQSGGIRNSNNGEILYYTGNTFFYRYNSSGSQLGTVNITIPGGASFNGTHMIYTGIPGQEVGFFDYSNKRVYLYSISGGSYSYYYSLPASAPVPVNYGFAYTNGRIFLSTDGTWYGYPLTATAPANPSSISASANPICNGFSSNLTANGADGTVYWYTSSCGGTQVSTGNTYTVSPSSTTTYYARNYNNSQFSAGCASITITVNQPSYVGTLPTVASLVATGTGIKWYAASIGGTPLASATPLVSGNHYYASQTVNGCESTTRLDVVATVDPTPCAPTGSAIQTYSTGSTVANLVATGANIRWYSAGTGGTALAGTTILINGSQYWASQTVDCTESATRFEVTVTIL